MEDVNHSFEVALFGDKINSTQAAKPGMNNETEVFDTDNTNNKKVSKISGGTAESRVGPCVILKVMAGDKIKASTFAWYKPIVTDNSVDQNLAPVILNLLGQLTPGVSALAKGGAVSQITSNMLQPGMENLLGNQTPISGAPKAFLNYVLLDEQQFKAVKYGATPVPVISSGMQKQFLQADNGSEIEMTKNGYLYVFVSNESRGDVYFDDIRIEYKKGPLLEETHYYPFGLTMTGISSKALGVIGNKIKFNGIEHNSDFDINMYDAYYRNLDPQTGRFWQIDPKPVDSISPYAMMYNNPVRYNDPLGDTIVINLFNSSGSHDVPGYNASNAAVSKQVNDGVFLVFGHGANYGLQYTDQNGNTALAASPEKINSILSEKSPEYKQALEGDKPISLTINACNVAANEYIVQNSGAERPNPTPIAQQLSTTLPKGSTVTGPDGYVWFGKVMAISNISVVSVPGILGVQATSAAHPRNTGHGGYVTFQDGVMVSKKEMPFFPSPAATASTKQ